MASGFDGQLKWVAKGIASQYECKIHITGFDKVDEKQLNILNRMPSWHGKGKAAAITYEDDLATLRS